MLNAEMLNFFAEAREGKVDANIFYGNLGESIREHFINAMSSVPKGRKTVKLNDGQVVTDPGLSLFSKLLETIGVANSLVVCIHYQMGNEMYSPTRYQVETQYELFPRTSKLIPLNDPLCPTRMWPDALVAEHFSPFIAAWYRLAHVLLNAFPHNNDTIAHFQKQNIMHALKHAPVDSPLASLEAKALSKTVECVSRLVGLTNSLDMAHLSILKVGVRPNSLAQLSNWSIMTSGSYFALPSPLRRGEVDEFEEYPLSTALSTELEHYYALFAEPLLALWKLYAEQWNALPTAPPIPLTRWQKFRAHFNDSKGKVKSAKGGLGNEDPGITS